MLQLKCLNCGADITLDDTREFGFCSYCGTKVLLDEYKKRVDGVPGVANLLLRADDFLKQGNVEKAREYYNRVLDIDINNNEANSRLNSIKQREKVQQAEREKLFSDSDYRRAKEIFNFINSQYETKKQYLEGILRCQSGDYGDIYSLIPCSKEDAGKHSPTYVGYTRKNGLLTHADIQKIYNILCQNLKKAGYKYDILFLAYEERQAYDSFWGSVKKWKKTGNVTHDIWIRIWK